jgi:hypothetical protein
MFGQAGARKTRVSMTSGMAYNWPAGTRAESNKARPERLRT